MHSSWMRTAHFNGHLYRAGVLLRGCTPPLAQRQTLHWTQRQTSPTGRRGRQTLWEILNPTLHTYLWRFKWVIVRKVNV